MNTELFSKISKLIEEPPFSSRSLGYREFIDMSHSRLQDIVLPGIKVSSSPTHIAAIFDTARMAVQDKIKQHPKKYGLRSEDLDEVSTTLSHLKSRAVHIAESFESSGPA